MDKKAVTEALKALKKDSSKKKFNQSIDLIINLKDLDLKKPDQQVDSFVTLHYTRGKKMNVAAFVGPELLDQAKKACNDVIPHSDFKEYDAKKAKKLANNNNFFIAQANVMKDVAGSFGRILGPRNLMPNPKAGAIVPPNANLKQLVEKMQKIVRVQAKKAPVVQVMVGKEDQPDTEIVDNILTIYNQVMHALPQEKDNIKNTYLKLTMSKPVKI